MLSRFFIDRPVFACVVSLLIVLMGTVSILALPIDRYPQITPPTVQISASYPGADAQTVASAVAAPIEEQLSGTEHLIYYSSQSSNNGTLGITATFEIGSDQDIAAVEIQNRLSQAQPRLPEAVVRQGITVTKSSSSILAVASLQSEDPRYDDLFLSNYAEINLLDKLRRVQGVGNARVFGSKSYSMRIWVDPDRLTSLGLTVSDVAGAIREQNAVFPSGTIGQRPNDGEVELTVPVLTQGRLNEVSEYEKIIVRANPDGSVVRLGDVARIELGSQGYNQVGRVNGKPTALMLINLQNGANALGTIQRVRQALDEAQKTFPSGIYYHIPYDTTTFISTSVKEVIETLFIAVVLVIFVVFVFLQSWRATLIPLLAVPVAIVGTFAGMLALGFSINTLTLFGLVLAIGIVVDDAIIVVENVERIMEEEGLAPKQAAIRAMEQVTGPVIAVVLVLLAVFVPVTFLGGLIGQLYKQFAVTIAISVSISGLVALSLSPALCSILLKPSHPKPLLPARWFNKGFGWITSAYTTGVGLLTRHVVIGLILFGVLGYTTYSLSQRVPGGFLPQEDQGYIILAVQLPDGASLERTDKVVRKAEQFMLNQPQVEGVVTLEGLDLLSGFTANTAASTMFISLKPFDERADPSMSAQALVATVKRNLFTAGGKGMILPVNPPPIQGLGQRAGFQMQLEDRGGNSIEDLGKASQTLLATGNKDSRVTGLNPTLRLTVPQLVVNLNRSKAKIMGVNIANIFESLQAYLGSLFVNDFNKFGRTYRVQLQAESSFRDNPRDIQKVYVRNTQGEMVPLSSVVDTHFKAGPNLVSRFNGFPSVQITGAATPGVSSGEAIDAMRELAGKSLPAGYAIEWSGASYQQIKAGNQAPIVLAFGLVVVFLVLAAQYERWLLPVAVLLAVPFAIFGALVAIMFRGLTQDLYFQIGLLTLVGLAAKNAILIVEFCVYLRDDGTPLLQAATEAARLRFRPIIMTSLAFIFGVLPLAISNGAGAGARHSIGTGVIGGMLAATFLATFFVPMFYVILQWCSEKVLSKRADPEENEADTRPDQAARAQG